MTETNELEYTGFWLRVWASIIDTVLLMMVLAPLGKIFVGTGYFSYYGPAIFNGASDFVVSFVLPALAVIAFWTARHATPGKMAIGAKIVDEKTGNAPTFRQHVIRYAGYYISAFFFCLGFLWVAWDSKKQGWHDKLAGTVVVRPKHGGTEPVRFNG